MAVTAISESQGIHRFPQYKYVDVVRWLPLVSAFDRFAVLALFDFDSDVSTIEIHSYKPNPLSFEPQSSWVSPYRVSSLKASLFLQKTIIAASTTSGSLHFLFSDSTDATLESEVSVPEGTLHSVPASCVDLMDGGVECVTVGEDGKVNLVTVGNSNLNYRRLFDSGGLVSYTAAKWASPMEFATGGYGFGLQWWDQRKPGGPVSQFKGNWDKKFTAGIVHSIDIHPSRKHTCLAGGSMGTLFAWDLRWQQQPIILAGAGNTGVQSISESEVWEVQYDRCIKSNTSSTKILPAMICSEDGILAVVEQGEEPIELLAEPCAINSFDIDRHNPSFRVGSSSHIDKAITLRVILVGCLKFRKECILLMEEVEESGDLDLQRQKKRWREEMEKGAPATIDLKRDGMEDLTGRVHQLPCCIKHDGPASVSHYFKPKPTGVGDDGLPLQQAHFRGRLLHGTTFHLPQGYSGFVLGKKSSPHTEEENSHSWETNATFHDITYWNHDYVPSQNDDFLRAFHWLTVAKALHNPVTPEELASSSIAL
ncbi:WD40/YVTN repeat-like-containing domain superfamily [Sesbania bispinosa]|nr:WD40/YVTN repeat-like-containing domain superfamily [Sesbania bispinosa]